MSRTPRLAVTVFLALVTAGAAFSEEGPDYGEPGFYVLGQVGGAFFRKDVHVEDLAQGYGNVPKPGDPPGTPMTIYAQGVNNKISYGLRLGHRWENFAVEVDGDYVAGTVNSFNVTMNGKWYPLTTRIQPYLMAGLGFSYIRPELFDDEAKTVFGGTVFAMRAGLGVEFYITEHWYTDVGVMYHYVTGPGNREFEGRSNNQGYVGARGGIGYRFF